MYQKHIFLNLIFQKKILTREKELQITTNKSANGLPEIQVTS
jgi:hypothetical protein